MLENAQQILQKYFPNAKFKLNGDKSCTPELINLSKNSDYFVFASKTKHSAFECIQNNRNDLDPLIYSLGKGSSSIINALIN